MTSTQSGAEDERDRRDEEAVHDRRDGAAEEEREAAGGRGEQDGQGLEAPLAGDRLAHPEQAGDRGGDEAVPDHEERVVRDARGAAEVDEEDGLEERIGDEHRQEDPRVDPGEERSVARQPAVEEDAQPVHESLSVARSRASRSNHARHGSAIAT